MTIHIHAADDFPLDCNAEEAILLRRELAYYILRRRGRTRVVVHFEDYSPRVSFPEACEFLHAVFGDLVRLERIHPFRIASRLRLASRLSETGRIFQQQAKATIRAACQNLDPHATKQLLHVTYRYSKKRGRRVRHYYGMLPNAPGQSKRGEEPDLSRPLATPAPEKPRALDLVESYLPAPSVYFPEPATRREHRGIPITTSTEQLSMTYEGNPEAPHTPAVLMPIGYYYHHHIEPPYRLKPVIYRKGESRVDRETPQEPS